MRHIALKTATKSLWATLLLLLGTVSVSAQYYQLKVRTDDGQITSFNVESVDSVFFERVMPIGEAVDLGLSVKWASFNVGASKPEDYGNYYAWGETETKTDYFVLTYKYYFEGAETKITKYCSNFRFGDGFTDTLTTLLPEDDVAHVAWGGSWRMPTLAEFNELLNNCDWTWVTYNGVNGWEVTSRKDSSCSIFLPAACIRIQTILDNEGSGHYSSSSLDTEFPHCSWGLYFGSVVHRTSSEGRSYGRSVRPVCP